jgi:hypothetical protein
MTRPRTFDQKLEALLDDATPEQLQRMAYLANYAWRLKMPKIAPPETKATRKPKNQAALPLEGGQP